jgi:nucleoid-associated protein YgaU
MRTTERTNRDSVSFSERLEVLRLVVTFAAFLVALVQLILNGLEFKLDYGPVIQFSTNWRGIRAALPLVGMLLTVSGLLWSGLVYFRAGRVSKPSIFALLLAAIFLLLAVGFLEQDREGIVTEVNTQYGTAYIMRDENGQLLGSNLIIQRANSGERILLTTSFAKSMPDTLNSKAAVAITASVESQQTVNFRVGMLNNGDSSSLFTVRVEIYYQNHFLGMAYEDTRLLTTGEEIELLMKVPQGISSQTSTTFVVVFEPNITNSFSYPEQGRVFFIDLSNEMILGPVEEFEAQLELPSHGVISSTLPSGNGGNNTGIANSSMLPTCRSLPVLKQEGVMSWVYVVKVGDTLPSLARLFFGNDEHWRDIFQANSSIIGTPPPMGEPRLYPGQVLLIPGVQTPIKYQVQGNDSLTSIAGQFFGNDYGSGRFWCTIYFLNYEIIGNDPSIISVGQVLSVFPLAVPDEHEIWVRPGDMFTELVDLYYLASVDASQICAHQGGVFGVDCNDLKAFDVVTLPDLPVSTRVMVSPGQSWDLITYNCYGDTAQNYLKAAQLINREVIGDDPQWLRAGQILTLYGCRSSIN